MYRRRIKLKNISDIIFRARKIITILYQVQNLVISVISISICNANISLNPIICSLLSKYLATSYAYYDKYSNKIYPHYDFKVHRYYLHYDSLKYGWRIRLIGRIKENYTNTSIEIKLKPFKKFLRRMNKNINLNLEE